MSPDLSVGLSCPACGGAISVLEGETSVNCQYCGSTLFIEGDKGVQTIAFKNNMDRDKVMKGAEQWWHKGFKARDLKRTGKVTEVYPIYLPFWSTTVRVAGWVCGYEERQHSDSKGRTYTERIPKEVMVLDDYRYNNIACDPGDLGIVSLSAMNGEASLADFLMIPTFETTTSRDDALASAGEQAKAWARQKAAVTNVTFEKVHIFPKRMSIVYYPVWVVRYSYRDRMYMTSTDGVTGRILSGRAPGDPLFQSLAVTAGTSIGGLIAAGGIVFTALGNSAYGAIGGLVGGLIVLYATYRFFRDGSEIVEGQFSDRKPSTVQTMKSIGEAAKELQGVYR
jgi:DNA-directed RNA polymerase subunit RPC12/RpoP